MTVNRENETDAAHEARRSFAWYVTASGRSRRLFWISEVVLLVVSASVPVAGVLIPDDSRLPAALGAVVVVLVGLRSIFHWRENWTRFTLAGPSTSTRT